MSAKSPKQIFTTVYSKNPLGQIYKQIIAKNGDFTRSFKVPQLWKFASYEEMINMKNVQNYVNFSKIIILEELLAITHPHFAT